jgi:2-polyprenyl-3-methyl-5-hydroxy-6-metoxy-1,4-benzoquinol methylase
MIRDTSEFNSIRYSENQPLIGSELKRVEKVLRLIGNGKTVLDLGCWDGSISKLIMERGNTVNGLESSEGAVDKAKAKGIIVKQFNLESEVWPNFEKKFDVVYAGEIIEHVFDTDQFLQNIRNLLKEGAV